MLFTMDRNATPDAEKGPRATVGPEVRRLAHELLPPAKRDKIEIQLRSYGVEERLTEDEAVYAAAANRHVQLPVAVSSMIAGFGVAGVIGAGVVAMGDAHWLLAVFFLIPAGKIAGFVAVRLRAGSEVGDSAAAREIITMRRGAGPLTICFSEEPR